jgi:hypothetical protein
MTLTPSSPGSDPLIEELQKCEAALRAWLESSSVNALWFLVDPMEALRAANLGLKEETLLEMEAVIKSLADKLAPALAETAVAPPAPRAAGPDLRVEAKA